MLKPKERLTKREQERLGQIWQRYKAYPALKKAWIVKELLREVYTTPNYQIAAHKLKLLILQLETERTGELKAFGQSLKRWRPYILNYFNHPITNAYTEGIHNKIKMLKRVSFGFRNVDHYIAKIMLGCLPLTWLLLNFHHHV